MIFGALIRGYVAHLKVVPHGVDVVESKHVQKRLLLQLKVINHELLA